MIIQLLLKLISSFEWFLQPTAAAAAGSLLSFFFFLILFSFVTNMFEEGEECGKFIFSLFFWVTGCNMRGIEADATHMCHSQNGKF